MVVHGCKQAHGEVSQILLVSLMRLRLRDWACAAEQWRDTAEFPAWRDTRRRGAVRGDPSRCAFPKENQKGMARPCMTKHMGLLGPESCACVLERVRPPGDIGSV